MRRASCGLVLWLGALSACTNAAVVGRFCPMGECQPSEAPRVTPNVSQQQEAAIPLMMLNPVDAGACMPSILELHRKRLDIYMMVDDSSVMVLWWQDTLSAISSFLMDPNSAGIGIGLQFFGTSCDAASYAVPLVPIAPLPDNVMQLQQAFPIIPADKNATLPAMQGAVMYAKGWAKENPDRDVAVLLLTSGLPKDCDSTVDNVAQVARDANAQQPSIPTYVVVFGAIGAINVLASAGGTGDALMVAPGSAIELQQALNNVRAAARSCTFALPEKLQLDLRANRLDIDHVHSDGAIAPIPLLPDRASCDGQPAGYYPDDPHNPTSIVLCPEGCVQLGSDRVLASSCSPL